ncbi:MAG: phosphoribosylglycinamide formyltransferase [Hyphomicrobiales bacterium]
MEKNIVIFASGNGSNAENIIKHFDSNSKINVQAVFCNKTNAGVIQRAAKHKVSTIVFSKEELNSPSFISKLNQYNPDLIVLAGFLLLVPKSILQAYPNKIINIHPALLPKYGGKGMYGMNVHKAILDNKETESGISIHYVNECFDEGKIIFQAKCKVESDDNIESIAKKIHELEHKHYPNIINQVINDVNIKV